MRKILLAAVAVAGFAAMPVQAEPTDGASPTPEPTETPAPAPTPAPSEPSHAH